MRAYYSKAVFYKSAAEMPQFPDNSLGEVAFAGRSNVGKSSVINALTRQKKLAKTSKTPGRTQLINFFELDKNYYLVDLPGYGYAKVSESMRRKWKFLVEDYIHYRQSLKGVILIMDCRHPFTTFDQQMLDWTQQVNIFTHILLTKADKLSFSQQKKALLDSERLLLERNTQVTIQLFSSINSMGLEPLEKIIETYLTSKN